MRNTEKLWEKSVLMKMNQSGKTKAIVHSTLSNRNNSQNSNDPAKLENMKINKAICEKGKEDSSIYLLPETSNISMNSSQIVLNKTDTHVIQDVVELKNSQNLEVMNKSKVEIDSNQTILHPMPKNRPIFDTLEYRKVTMQNQNAYTMQMNKGLGMKSKDLISKTKFVKSILGKSNDVIGTTHTPEPSIQTTVNRKRMSRSNPRKRSQKTQKSSKLKQKLNWPSKPQWLK